MEKITLEELQVMANDARGYIEHIYVHWTAGRYHQFFDDYHINVDNDGSIYASVDDLTELLEHTWRRNSRAIGVCMAGCYNAKPRNGYDTNFGNYPPTQEQIDGLAKVIAVLCGGLGIFINYDHVKTHCEVAEEDGYGPSTTCERWDLWFLPDYPLGNELKPGGDVIRGKAVWWQQNYKRAKNDHKKAF